MTYSVVIVEDTEVAQLLAQYLLLPRRCWPTRGTANSTSGQYQVVGIAAILPLRKRYYRR